VTLPPVGLAHYLLAASLLFALGLFAVITRRHSIGILLGIELMLNAANINLVAFDRYGPLLPGAVPASRCVDGQVFALVVMALAACEAAAGLAIVLRLYQTLATVEADEAAAMKW
jgi:NADH:ubiquinone oxidoreductase subunit K